MGFARSLKKFQNCAASGTVAQFSGGWRNLRGADWWNAEHRRGSDFCRRRCDESLTKRSWMKFLSLVTSTPTIRTKHAGTVPGVPCFYLLPGLTAGILARSGGNLSASKVSTCNEIKLSNGTPKFTVPLE